MLQPPQLLLQDRLRGGRLGRAVDGIDRYAQGGGKTCRQTLGIQALPVLHRPGVVALVVRLQATKEHLPFQEGRAQGERPKPSVSKIGLTAPSRPRRLITSWSARNVINAAT